MQQLWFRHNTLLEATWQLLAAIGLHATRVRQEGIGMVAVEQHIEYKRELCAGDL